MKSRMKLLFIFVGIIGCSVIIPIITFKIITFSINTDSDKNIDFESLSKGYYGDYNEHNYFIINTPIVWEQVWNSTFSSQSTIPVINFTTNTIIAVYLGGRVTGGYHIIITRVGETPTNYNVYVTESSPSSTFTGKLTPAFSAPYHIIKTQKLTKNVSFVVTEYFYSSS